MMLFFHWYLYSKLSSKIGERGEELEIRELEAILEFKHWMQASGVLLYNAWATRFEIEPPHYFLYKKKRALNREETRMMDATELAKADEGDILCLVNNFVADGELLQEPLLVMPKAHAALVAPQATGKQ